MGQTVNLLAYAFDGSNPSLPTKILEKVNRERKLRLRKDNTRQWSKHYYILYVGLA